MKGKKSQYNFLSQEQKDFVSLYLRKKDYVSTKHISCDKKYSSNFNEPNSSAVFIYISRISDGCWFFGIVQKINEEDQSFY